MATTVIFGGAFDPPHIEHMAMCKAAMQQLGADSLVIVPTYMPPHKSEGFLSYEDRVDLIKIAFAEFGQRLIIDNIENERKNDNYSSEVLPLLKQKYGDIVYLIGGDSLEFMSTWHQPRQIAECCPIAVAGREGYENTATMAAELKASIGGEYILLDYIGADVSSAQIKARLLMGEPCDSINPLVAQEIKKRGLFEDYRAHVDRLKCYQSPQLYAHSKSVVLRAVDFNSKHHLQQDFRKVFLAALLHDNAKQRPSLDGLKVPVDSIETPVLHQFLGAEKARRDFGIEDKDILDAIRYHTTAKADMTMLEKLIYTADSLSDDRTYAPIPTLREIAKADFDKGFRSVLKYTYLKIIAKGKGMYPLTEQAAQYYLK